MGARSSINASIYLWTKNWDKNLWSKAADYRSSFFLLIAAASSAGQDPAISSQSSQKDGQDDVIRVDANLATVPVVVMDRDCRYITDLRKEDFEISGTVVDFSKIV